MSSWNNSCHCVVESEHSVAVFDASSVALGPSVLFWSSAIRSTSRVILRDHHAQHSSQVSHVINHLWQLNFCNNLTALSLYVYFWFIYLLLCVWVTAVNSYWWQVLHNGNTVGHINKVYLGRVQLLLGLVTFGRSTILNSSRPLSLATPPWEHAMSTGGGGFGHRWGRNGELCVVACPVTRTAHILACHLKVLAVNLSSPSSLHGLYASLIWSNPHWLKVL